MSTNYEKLLAAAQTLQDQIKLLKESAGSDTSKRLLLEQCYSAVGAAIRFLVILGVADDNDSKRGKR